MMYNPEGTVASKIRKQIYLDPAQEALLKRLAGATGLAEADLIRQALDRHLGTDLPTRPLRQSLRAGVADR